MLSFLAWYFVASLLGWLSFPLAYRLFPALADRGFSLSRALGLLLWGYVFWLMASLRMIQNNLSGLALALVILVAISAAAILRKTKENGSIFDLKPLGGWLRSNRRLVVTVEVLFFLAFAVCVFVRASNPEATTAGGEKVMEVAFINAILRSPTFPPHDPWLSGYAISYYYFGYVMAAMLAEVTGVLGSVAHNLMLSLVFSLSAVGAYGVLYDLLAIWHTRRPKIDNPQSSIVNPQSSILLPLLGPFFLLMVSNFEGFLEVLHRHGLFWKFNPDGTAASAFWTWLDIKELNVPPTLPLQWIPDRFLWWWRASRVVQNYDLAGHAAENIDEFPFFSYLLGDLHPHVLAMPFGLLAMAIALNVFLGGWKGKTDLFGLRLPIHRTGFLFSAVALGGLAFLNTWDILTGFALFVGAYALARVLEAGWTWKRLEEILVLGLPTGLLAILLYLPFYVGFSSQAGGILPNLENPARGAQLWVMFGALFIPVIAYFIYLWRSEKLTINWKWGFGLAVVLVVFLWGFSWLLGLLGQLVEPGQVQGYLAAQGGFTTALFFSAATYHRLTYTGGWLTLLGLLGAILALLIPLKKSTSRKKKAGAANPRSSISNPQSSNLNRQSSISNPQSPTPFVLLFILVAVLLILAPEFVFLRDQFGNRMNTIFKFYYQAWLVMSLAAAFGMAVMLQSFKTWRAAFLIFLLAAALLFPSGLSFLSLLGKALAVILVVVTIVLNGKHPKGLAFHAGLTMVLAVALTYPFLALPNKTDDFQLTAFHQRLAAARAAGDPAPLRTAARVWTLDGGAAFAERFPDDAAAVRFLMTAPDGIIVEAVGGEYSDYGHIAVYSGLPSVLNWPGHEGQWRGGYNEQISLIQSKVCPNQPVSPPRSRSDDVRCLYETRSWDEAKLILDRYQIRYVIVGTLERQTYQVREAKFQSNLLTVFQSGEVVVYEVPIQTDMLK